MRQIIKYLALIQLSTISLVSSDIYLPLLAVVAKDLDTSINLMQLTISVYFLTLGISQFFIGYLLDRFGQKSVFLFSLPIYLIGCTLCFNSNSLPEFCCGRLLQALGASAPLAAWQPLTTEFFGEKKGRTVGSYLFMLLSLSPGVAPILGAFISSLYGWRANFVFLSVIAVFCSLSSAYVMQSNNAKIGKPVVLEDLFKLLKNYSFLRYLVLISLNYSCYLSFIIAYPNIAVAERGAILASFEFLPIAVSFFLGALLSKSLMAGSRQLEAIKIGVVLSGVSAIFFVLGAVIWKDSTVFSLLIPFCVLVFASGIFLPASTYEAICAGGSMQNSASGLIGGMRMCVAFVISAALTLLPMQDQSTAVMAVICVASVFSILLIARLRPIQKVRISGARR